MKSFSGLSRDGAPAHLFFEQSKFFCQERSRSSSAAAAASMYSHVFSLPSLEAEVSKAYCQLDMLEWSHFLKMELIIHAS